MNNVLCREYDDNVGAISKPTSTSVVVVVVIEQANDTTMIGKEAEIIDADPSTQAHSRLISWPPGPITVFSREQSPERVSSLSMHTDRSTDSPGYHRHVVDCLLVEFGEAVIGQPPAAALCTASSSLGSDHKVAGSDSSGLSRTESEISTATTFRSASAFSQTSQLGFFSRVVSLADDLQQDPIVEDPSTKSPGDSSLAAQKQ